MNQNMHRKTKTLLRVTIQTLASSACFFLQSSEKHGKQHGPSNARKAQSDSARFRRSLRRATPAGYLCRGSRLSCQHTRSYEQYGLCYLLPPIWLQLNWISLVLLCFICDAYICFTGGILNVWASMRQIASCSTRFYIFYSIAMLWCDVFSGISSDVSVASSGHDAGWAGGIRACWNGIVSGALWANSLHWWVAKTLFG